MILRKVEDVVFKNAVVHITGNAFFRCKFHECTFVFQGFPCHFDGCNFDGVHVWRIECTIHDSDQWDNFMSILANLITKSLPKTPPPNEGKSKGKQ